jgi:drug/metabolite transporter (DMT)-like permease
MSNTALGHLFLITSILASALGHTLLKGVISPVPLHVLRVAHLVETGFIGRLVLALFLLVISFVAWLGAIRNLDLSYAYGMASASIIIVAMLAAAWLGEVLGLRAWLGFILIVAGCMLLAPQYAGRSM